MSSIYVYEFISYQNGMENPKCSFNAYHSARSVHAQCTLRARYSARSVHAYVYLDETMNLRFVKEKV